VDWRRDQVRGKASGKQEGAGWFREEAKDEAGGATAHTFRSHCCRRGRLPLSSPTPIVAASTHPVFSPSVFLSAGRCISGARDTCPFLGRGLDEPHNG
jgi:hypothetical protein